MKNEVKLNIHLFFPEQQNEEISDTRNEALKALLELSELNDENSIEKFTNELKTRFELIKPILGNETEDFLGYNQENVEKITKFFNGNYEKFGMDAVAVQKILRSIWLKTPCNDKRLNYDLYDFIDKKFYGIINERKNNISFDDISAPADSSWEELVRHWTECRERYADKLGVSLEYLNREAIDGLQFPSASGLFANPVASIGDDTERDIVEFLNFWMPHFTQHPFEEGINSSLDEKIIYLTHLEYIVQNIDKLPNYNWLDVYKKYFKSIGEKQLGWQLVHTKENSQQLTKKFNEAKLYLDELANKKGNFVSEKQEDVFNQDVVTFLKKSKDRFCIYFKEYYKNLQPTHFWAKPENVEEETPQMVYEGTLEKRFGYSLIVQTCQDDRYNPGYGERIDVNLLHQLPRFINSCNEYIVKDACIYKSKCLEFYDNADNMEKINFPDDKDIAILLQLFRTMKLITVTIPHTTDIESLEEYYQNYYLKFSMLILPFQLRDGESWNNSWYDIVERVKQRRQYEFHEALLQCIQTISKEELSSINKLDILEAIKNYIPIEDAFFSIEINKIEEPISQKDKPICIYKSALLNKIAYIRERDISEKLKLQAAEAKAREAMFNESCHAIGGLTSTVQSNIEDTQDDLKNYSPSIENVHLQQAHHGAYILSQHARTITLASRKLDDDWEKDICSNERSAKKFKDILWLAFCSSVAHVFFRDIRKFFHYTISKNYFDKREEMNKAKEKWYNSKTINDQFKWVKDNLFDLTWNDYSLNSDIKIDDNHFIQTHLFVLFYEIFLNAIKAISYTKKDCRFFSITISNKDNMVFIEMSNSISDENMKSYGQGNFIIRDYMRKFSVNDFITLNNDNNTYKMSFSLPFLTKGE